MQRRRQQGAPHTERRRHPRTCSKRAHDGTRQQGTKAVQAWWEIWRVKGANSAGGDVGENIFSGGERAFMKSDRDDFCAVEVILVEFAGTATPRPGHPVMFA